MKITDSGSRRFLKPETLETIDFGQTRDEKHGPGGNASLNGVTAAFSSGLSLGQPGMAKLCPADDAWVNYDGKARFCRQYLNKPEWQNYILLAAHGQIKMTMPSPAFADSRQHMAAFPLIYRQVDLSFKIVWQVLRA